MKRVLVLGAGLVVRPLLDELFSRGDLEVEVAALNVDRARELVAGQPHGRATELDSSNRAELHRAVGASDLTISLLPADLHPQVAEACLESKVPLITSSYVSDAMKALDGEARRRGVLLLNECGLDPGIDHMLAAQVIRRVRQEGDEIEAFASYCGGLPAPADNDNPWGYKLSWSPRGVLLSGRSPVRYLEGGTVVEHDNPYGPGAVRNLTVAGVGEMEVYPTRDSLKYRKPYRLEHLGDLFRGTIRYPGWSDTLRSLLTLGLLELEPVEDAGETYGSLTARKLPGGDGDLRSRVAAFLGRPVEDDVLDRLEWLGLFAGRPLSEQVKAPLDQVAALFQEKLQYAPGEQDMVALEHHFTASHGKGRQRRIVARMLVFGEAGDRSAMALTVGTPAGLAAGLILDGAVDLTGVRIPVDESLTEPILAGLRQRGFQIEEEETSLG